MNGALAALALASTAALEIAAVEMPSGEWQRYPDGTGLFREYAFDDPTDLPVIFGGSSRAVAVSAEEYCLYLDIWYADGSTQWGYAVSWTQGTHDWERVRGVFQPRKPVRRIIISALLRKGDGKAEFGDLSLEQREGRDDVICERRVTNRPYEDGDRLDRLLLRGRALVRDSLSVPASLPVPESPLAPDAVEVWSADSMRRVSPLTFPDETERAASKRVGIELAKGECESVQVLISTGRKLAISNVVVQIGDFRNKNGETLKGTVEWRRIGYVPRVPESVRHPLGVSDGERWLPEPLLPPAPFEVRKNATQGVWVTVRAGRDAAPGIYGGRIELSASGVTLGKVVLGVRVRDFALPRTFGFPFQMSVMDGFTRMMYPGRFAEMRGRLRDMMLEHRLNFDDISRTDPPSVEDLRIAREKGMSRFNILNIAPKPTNPNKLWTWVPPLSELQDPGFYPAFRQRLATALAEIRAAGLADCAYVYGFDECKQGYYPIMEELLGRIRKDFPGLPIMTTSHAYADARKNGRASVPGFDAIDWQCPHLLAYDPVFSQGIRRDGRQVWWYVSCSPGNPYANFASVEHPPADGRIFGWMSFLNRVDGTLFWHSNYWQRGNTVDSSDTFAADYRLPCSDKRIAGDGVLAYPGGDDVYPSIRLAQIRDSVEDIEWMRLAAERTDAASVDTEVRAVVRSLTDFSRDPKELRRHRTALGNLIEMRGK